MRWRLVVVAGAVVAVAGALVVAIGPDISWQLLRHGDTSVWDHLEYPTRALSRSARPSAWHVGAEPDDLPAVPEGNLTEVLTSSRTLAFVVIRDGEVVTEWYGERGGPHVRSMVFSVSKSLVSLLVGAALDDGLIESVHDPVTRYVPELAPGGFNRVTIEDLLRMDSSMDYVEDHNPLGIHIPFNFTRNLRGMILSLSVRDEPDPQFRYKSGDNALVGLILERALDGPTLTSYLQDRLWDPLGAERAGSWNVDHEGGFERTWCCLAITARDLARFGHLVVQDGVWDGAQLISRRWLAASFEPGFTPDRWPDEFTGSALANYGYQWWLLDDGSRLALGKDGQYLFIQPERGMVIVRLGESQGDVPWTRIMQEIAAAST
jgi:CubicO group peptidase (beta-lactamase class C family)